MPIDYNIGEFEYNNSENYNRRNPQPRGEVNDEPSMTVPGEALSIKEIMERALNGIVPRGQEAPFFDQQNLDMINERPIDITDLESQREALINMQEEVEAEIERLQSEPDPEADPEPPQPNPEP